MQPTTSTQNVTQERSIVYVGGLAESGYYRGLTDICGELDGLDKNSNRRQGMEVKSHIVEVKKDGRSTPMKGNQYALFHFKDETSAAAGIKCLNNHQQKGILYKTVSFLDPEVVDNNGLELVLTKPSLHPEEEVKQYRKFIKNLREVLADHNEECGAKEKVGSRPVLPKQQGGKQPDRWIHIKLSVKENGSNNVQESIKLVIHDYNLYVKGFTAVDTTATSKNNIWFELCGPDETVEQQLPNKYYNNVKRLDNWGVAYSSIMGLNDVNQANMTLMKSARLGKDFAVRAVSRLSRYPDLSKDNNDDNPVRLGLAGLIVMICEAARMEPLLDHIAEGWAAPAGVGLDDKLICFIHNWKNMSKALLDWSVDKEKKWNSKWDVAPSSDSALSCVSLVLKSNKKIDADHGAKVEILDVSANVGVRSINITEENEHRSHEIYTDTTSTAHTDNQGGDMQKLGLATARKAEGISAYNWFDIKVDLHYPDPESSYGSILSFTKRLGCRPQQLAPEKAHPTEDTISVSDTTSVSDNPSRKMTVTYLVIPNAVKATVQVRLPVHNYNLYNEMDNGDSSPEIKEYKARGKITAHICDSEAYPIVLFDRLEGNPFCFKSDKPVLELQRPTVHVPHGKKLQIGIEDLRITTTPDWYSWWEEMECEVEKPAGRADEDGGRLSFSFGCCNPDHDVNNDSEMEVNVGWGHHQKEINPKHTPGGVEKTTLIIIDGDCDAAKFAELINNLRSAVVANRRDIVDLDTLEAYQEGTEQFSYDPEKSHPVLNQVTTDKPRWIHVRLQVKEGDETWSIDLAVQDDYCHGVGFMNQSGVWYDLGDKGKNKRLPVQYNSVLLDWGVSYPDILGMKTWKKVEELLSNKLELGKGFVTKAVRILSRYPDVDEDVSPSPREALAGLIIMLCESARYNRLRDHFLDGWDLGTGFGTQPLMDYIYFWGYISRALWRAKHGRSDWIDNRIRQMEINDKQLARDAVHLVFTTTHGALHDDCFGHRWLKIHHS